jgi:uncharacterized protein (TIGR01777 family)
MRITLTGATGFVGSHLLPLLSARGHQFSVLTRSPEKARERLRVPCDLFAWDGKTAVPTAAVDGADAVIHLAGEGVAESRWTAEQKRCILESRTLSAKGLLAAIAGQSHRPKIFLSASAIGFYGGRGDEILTEASPRGQGFLADVCEAWESEVRKASDLGMREARVRVGIVLGAEGGALAKLIPLFRRGLGGPVGGGKQWMSWIHAADIAELFARVLENEEARGVYNGVGPEPVTNRDFSQALGRALDKSAWLPTPAAALRLAMGEMASVVLDSQRVISRRVAELGFSFRYSTLDAALTEICRR